MVRYVIVFFLGVLFLLIAGIALGYLSFDLSMIDGPRLSLASSLAYYCDDYDDCDTNEEPTIYYGGPLDPGGEGTQYYDYRGPFTADFEDGDGIEKVLYSRDDSDLYGYRSEPRIVEDEWIEDVWYENRNQQPWYASSFPGIGSMLQNIIPGLRAGVSVRAPSPPPVYTQPSCWISANPMSVEYGKSSTLQWSASYATRASLTDYGAVPLSGSRIVQNIKNDRVYQLTVSGQGGSGSCYTRISVRAASGQPSCFISAYPGTISSGESASLAWGSQQASSAYLSGVGTVSPTGGTYVAPSQTTTYTLTVFGPQGTSNTCTAEIGVLP